MLKAIRTTYSIGGEKQKCIKVYDTDNKDNFVRFVPLFRYFSKPSTLVIEYVDKEVNSKEEINILWQDLTTAKALSYVKKYCVYVG